MEIINLCPHKIVLQLQDGSRQEILPSGVVARCSVPQREVFFGSLPLPVIKQGDPGPVENLPEPKEETFYLVSAMVFNHSSVKDRFDLIAPGTGPNDDPIRENGQVIAITKFLGRK